MSPTIEEQPVRHFLIQLKASETGKWAPTIKVHADTVCEWAHEGSTAEGNYRVVHIFKKGQTVVAKVVSETIASWSIEEDAA